jgi:signal transduction histidine kinase
VVLGGVPETEIGSLTMLKLPGDEFVTLELVHDPTRGRVQPGGLSHRVIQVEDVHATVTHLAVRGVQAEDPSSPDGSTDFWTAWVTDPDGYRIELVAHGAALPEIFAAVASEASHLLGNLAAVLLRYDNDGDAVTIAAWNSPVPLGLRMPAVPTSTAGKVLATGKPFRIDSYAAMPFAQRAAELGIGAAVAVPVAVEGRLWGVLSISSPDLPLPMGTEGRLIPFAELAAAAIANAENKEKLTASRARVVATADETRRRLQRDVHDSAQQRLVHTIITLKLARDEIAAGGSAVDLVAEALTNAERANSDLRDVVHGILPAALTRGGLRTGLDSLVADFSMPIELSVTEARLPASLETTAYFIVAEALTNVVKHARATHISVTLAIAGDHLDIQVRDDGNGGADPAQGSGLTGLLDRVEASDGTLAIESPEGSGTALCARLPINYSTCRLATGEAAKSVRSATPAAGASDARSLQSRLGNRAGGSSHVMRTAPHSPQTEVSTERS